MEKFEINILGCGAALPTPRRLSSSQIVNIREKLFMIDCGEGTQIALRRSKIAFSRLQNVFLSHLHGDHCLGIIGMLSTFGLLGRTTPLHIFAPHEFESMLHAQLEMFCHGLEYEVVFHAVDTTKNTLIYEDRGVTVETIPLEHRVPCCGYLFREKANKPHIIREMTDFYGIPYYAYNSIKDGKPWMTEDGEIVPAERLTRPAEPPRAYAYISDTAPSHVVAENVVNVDLLYHEATFGKDNIKRAEETYHTTAAQAAEIAASCHVHRLIIGHFSSRYKDETPLLEEAQAIFPNTVLAEEGKTYTI